MKEANLISVLSAFKKLYADLFQSYLEYHSINIKDEELNDLEILLNCLKPLTKEVNIFDKYFIGFTIPQIGKEFDLLRIDDKSIVNIELKKKSTPEKIKKQLLRNKYYLSFLKRETYIFTFVAEEAKLYSIDDDKNLIESDIEQLLTILVSQEINKIEEIESYFNPSNYLVSPFNSTLEFVRGEYFLTIHQEEIKNTILSLLDNSGGSFFSIKGTAGTGKTLLTYDIAKDFNQHEKILIIHCGILNRGHLILRGDYKWDIVSASVLLDKDLSQYHLIIVDEAQRIYPKQLNHIINEVKKNSNNCIFSYDGQQTLRKQEINNNIEEQIEKEIIIKPFELTNKIRANKEVATFIQCLFDKNRLLEKFKYPKNIELNYFDNNQDAINFLLQLKSEDWKIINYTPSTVHTLPYEIHKIDDEPDNAHRVIGQEYDNVVAVIDKYFYYKDNKLSTKNYEDPPYYHPTKMLFQIVSRTRIKLNVVIINNQDILSRCLDILNHKKLNAL